MSTAVLSEVAEIKTWPTHWVSDKVTYWAVLTAKKILTITENCLFLHCSKQFQKRNLSQWPLELEHRRILLMCCCFCIFQSYLKSFCLATLNTLYRLVYLFLPTNQQCWKGCPCKQPEQLFGEILNLLKLLHGWRIFFGNFKNGRNAIYIWQLK